MVEWINWWECLCVRVKVLIVDMTYSLYVYIRSVHIMFISLDHLSSTSGQFSYFRFTNSSNSHKLIVKRSCWTDHIFSPGCPTSWDRRTWQIHMYKSQQRNPLKSIHRYGRPKAATFIHDAKKVHHRLIWSLKTRNLIFKLQNTKCPEFSIVHHSSSLLQANLTNPQAATCNHQIHWVLFQGTWGPSKTWVSWTCSLCDSSDLLMSTHKKDIFQIKVWGWETICGSKHK